MSDIELIDSHCHLIFENFEKDLEDVVIRMRSKGIKKLVTSSLNKAFSLIDKAVKKNVLHKNTGANKKSKINNFVKNTLTTK